MGDFVGAEEWEKVVSVALNTTVAWCAQIDRKVRAFFC